MVGYRYSLVVQGISNHREEKRDWHVLHLERELGLSRADKENAMNYAIALGMGYVELLVRSYDATCKGTSRDV